ncbi:hypothetical protein RDI58_008654 [Solanum bulbocastanum]|uniref:Uncharacterized protein n=1 Tax=Solanum bulbocastanum TaxID=147425 RepID=A0AAN8U2X9_SOLBU
MMAELGFPFSFDCFGRTLKFRKVPSMVSDNMAAMSEIKNKDCASVFCHMMKWYKQTSKDVTDTMITKFSTLDV